MVISLCPHHTGKPQTRNAENLQECPALAKNLQSAEGAPTNNFKTMRWNSWCGKINLKVVGTWAGETGLERRAWRDLIERQRIFFHMGHEEKSEKPIQIERQRTDLKDEGK